MRLANLFLSLSLTGCVVTTAAAQDVPSDSSQAPAAVTAQQEKDAAKAAAVEAKEQKLAAARARAAAARAAKVAASQAKAARLRAAKLAAAAAKAAKTSKTTKSIGLRTPTSADTTSNTSASNTSSTSTSSTTATGSPDDPIDAQENADPGLTPYVAFAWHAPDSAMNHVVGTVWYASDSDPVAVADQLKALPAGERSLLRWQSTQFLLGSTSDPIIGPDGDTYWGPWLDNGVTAEAAFENQFLSQVQAAGGEVDYLTLDTEWQISTWSLSTGQLNAILADPRWPALADAFGVSQTDDLIDIINPDSQAFDLAMQVTIGTEMHAAFDAPLVAQFPAAHCSDFNDVVLSPEAAVQACDANGCVQPASLPLHGDTQGPSFYAYVGNIGIYDSQGADFTQPMPVLCWEASAARGYAQSDIPVMPWFPGKTWSLSTLANSPYYDEMVFHVLLGCGSVNVNLWNADPDHTDDDCTAIDNDLAELAQVTSNAPTLTPLTTDPVAYTSSVLVSGAQCPSGQRVYRITVPTVSQQDQTLSVVLPGDTNATSVTVPAGACGTWLVR